MVRFGIGLCSLLLLRAISAEDSPVYWPGSSEWETRPPEESGFTAARLHEALDFAGAHNSTGVVVVRGGYIVAERYWQGWDADSADLIFSSTKSIAAVLVGMAIDDGKMRSVDQPVSDFIPSWKGTEKEIITLKHLLSMTSGLGGARDYLRTNGFDAFEKMSAVALDVKPGTVWKYHTPAYRMLPRLIEIAVNEPIAAYQERRLFGPLGMKNTKWETTTAGGGKSNYLFMRSSTRDMARFGLLVLRGGKWNGQQLVSAHFLREALSPSQELNKSYGYLWWLNGQPSYIRPGGNVVRPGPMWPDCPVDAVGALGANDKKIYVIPSLDLVVARHGGVSSPGGDPAGVSEFDNAFLGRICNAIRP